ncbi:MAG: LPS export ABC transporter periplasmic protein LptC [Betaproteobacteria bacterium]
MKRWSGQIFPLAVLALLAALSFWLQRVVDLPESRHDGKLRHDPDTVVERFMVRHLNAEGTLQYRLQSPHMFHYADDDSSLIQKPRLTYYRPDVPDMILTGQQALVTENGDNVYIWGDVVATRLATPERPEMVARMPDLTVRPDDGIGFTKSPVEITEGKTWLKGVGMDIDNNQATFALQSKVTGLIYRTKQQP